LNGDKKALTELRDELRDPEGEFRVPSTFLMEDIKVDPSMLYNHKFEAIWTQIKKGDNKPLCILYGGETSGSSQGINSEIQNVAQDEEKKANSVLIRHEKAALNHYADAFPYHTAANHEDFKRIAMHIVRSKINEIKTFLQTKGGGVND